MTDSSLSRQMFYRNMTLLLMQQVAHLFPNVLQQWLGL
ncbi:Uncharacterised protein [Vibrio cholerae]|nr:Uncharacterised protein [Vibrio cholerae]CSI53739.1 Uncharacterised protein [Vibrio cholerae]CSI56779.1 Uncharacterised protein [Vibrio cholerae]